MHGWSSAQLGFKIEVKIFISSVLKVFEIETRVSRLECGAMIATGSSGDIMMAFVLLISFP